MSGLVNSTMIRGVGEINSSSAFSKAEMGVGCSASTDYCIVYQLDICLTSALHYHLVAILAVDTRGGGFDAQCTR